MMPSPMYLSTEPRCLNTIWVISVRYSPSITSTCSGCRRSEIDVKPRMSERRPGARGRGAEALAVAGPHQRAQDIGREERREPPLVELGRHEVLDDRGAAAQEEPERASDAAQPAVAVPEAGIGAEAARRQHAERDEQRAERLE